MIDPYAVLGIPRDATPAAVKSAFRRHVKVTHPDVGGNAEGFARVNLAHDVLIDQERRKLFDEAGTIVEEKPDNFRTNAIQKIARVIEGVVMEYIGKSLQGPDPRDVDVMLFVREELARELAMQEEAVRLGEKIIVWSRDMARRFETTDPLNPIAGVFETRIKTIEQQLETAMANVGTLHAALALAQTYTFRRESPTPPVGDFVTSSTWG